MKQFWKDLWHRCFIREDIFDLSAGLAYYFLMSFFPFLMFLLTILGYLPIPTDSIIKLLLSQTPQEASELVISNVKLILEEQRSGLLSIGIVLAIWSTSSAIHAVMRAINKAYGVEETRGYFKVKGLALLFTLGMLICIGVMLLVPLLQEFFPNHQWTYISNDIGMIVLFVVFSVLYYFAPNASFSWYQMLPGSVFALAAWRTMSAAFRFFVSHINNFSATYGSLSTIIALLIWFYLTAMMLILGSFINASIQTHFKKTAS